MPNCDLASTLWGNAPGAPAKYRSAARTLCGAKRRGPRKVPQRSEDTLWGSTGRPPSRPVSRAAPGPVRPPRRRLRPAGPADGANHRPLALAVLGAVGGSLCSQGPRVGWEKRPAAPARTRLSRPRRPRRGAFPWFNILRPLSGFPASARRRLTAVWVLWRHFSPDAVPEAFWPPFRPVRAGHQAGKRCANARAHLGFHPAGRGARKAPGRHRAKSAFRPRRRVRGAGGPSAGP
jgi:hypothetical protein